MRVRAGILACRSAAFRGLALSPLASFRRQYRDVALDLDVEGFLGARFAVVAGVRQNVAEAGVEFFAEVVLDDVVYRIVAERVDGFEIAGVIRRSLFFPFVVLRVLEVAQDSIEFPLHEEDTGKGDEGAEVVLLEDEHPGLANHGNALVEILAVDEGEAHFAKVAEALDLPLRLVLAQRVEQRACVGEKLVAGSLRLDQPRLVDDQRFGAVANRHDELLLPDRVEESVEDALDDVFAEAVSADERGDEDVGSGAGPFVGRVGRPPARERLHVARADVGSAEGHVVLLVAEGDKAADALEPFLAVSRLRGIEDRSEPRA